RAVPIGHLLERCWLAGRPRVLTSLWCLLLRLLAAQRCCDFVGVELVCCALGPVLGFVGPLPQVACHAHLLAFGQVLCGGLCGVAPGGDGQERGGLVLPFAGVVFAALRAGDAHIGNRFAGVGEFELGVGNEVAGGLYA